MIDFTDEHSKTLLSSPWLAKLHDKTGYLVKFSASTDSQNCCMLITDTEKVWAEVLESRHVARRARQCNPFEAEMLSSSSQLSEEHETAWMNRQLIQLSNLHSPYNMSDIEFVVNPTSKHADLEVTLKTEDFSWRWDALSLPHRLSSQLLSQHLITPLLSLTALAASIDEPLRDVSSYSLTHAADSQAKTAKRHLGRSLVGCMAKPMILTTMRRITQVIEGDPNPGSIAINEEDYPTLETVPPPPPTNVSSPHSNSNSSSAKRRRSASPSQRQASQSIGSKQIQTQTQNGKDDAIPTSSQRTNPNPSQRKADLSDTEDEDEVKAEAEAAADDESESFVPHLVTKRERHPPPSSRSPSPHPAPRKAPPQLPAADDEHEEDAETRRKAAIFTRLQQQTGGPSNPNPNPVSSVKAPAKRRRF